MLQADEDPLVLSPAQLVGLREVSLRCSSPPALCLPPSLRCWTLAPPLDFGVLFSGNLTSSVTLVGRCVRPPVLDTGCLQIVAPSHRGLHLGDWLIVVTGTAIAAPVSALGTRKPMRCCVDPPLPCWLSVGCCTRPPVADSLLRIA